MKIKKLRAKVSEFLYNHPKISTYIALKPLEVAVMIGAYGLFPEETRAAMNMFENNLHLFAATASTMPHDILHAMDNARQIYSYSIESVDSAVDVISDISSKLV